MGLLLVDFNGAKFSEIAFVSARARAGVCVCVCAFVFLCPLLLFVLVVASVSRLFFK